jgi:SAM-dependent methyltransferase
MTGDEPYEATIEQVYSDWAAGQTEGGINSLLDESLHPRGPDMLFDIAAELGVGEGATVLDAGCRDGRHMVELVNRFECRTVGLELVRANLTRARELRVAAGEVAAAKMKFVQGDIQRMPFDDGTFDLVWNRDVMIHLPDVAEGLRECRRVVKPGGRMLLFQMFATDWLSEGDAARLWPPIAVTARNTDPSYFEACIEEAGWEVQRVEHLRSEWREFEEEAGDRKTSKQLLQVARLLRDPDKYISRMGRGDYESEIANALWGVYQMIGKLSGRVYVLA